MLSVSWSFVDHSVIIQALRKGFIEREASDTGGVPRWKSSCPDRLAQATVRNVAITVQNLIAVFPNYSSLYLVFLCFLTLSRAIIVLGVWLWLGWVGFIYLFSGFGETQFAALNRQQ